MAETTGKSTNKFEQLLELETQIKQIESSLLKQNAAKKELCQEILQGRGKCFKSIGSKVITIRKSADKYLVTEENSD